MLDCWVYHHITMSVVLGCSLPSFLSYTFSGACLENPLSEPMSGHTCVLMFFSKEMSLCRQQSVTRVWSPGSPGVKVDSCMCCTFPVSLPWTPELCVWLSMVKQNATQAVCLVWAENFTLKSQFTEAVCV